MGSYKQQLNAFYKGEMGRYEVFSVSNAPAVLQKHGMPGQKIIMTQKVARKVTRPERENGTGHGISRQAMKDLRNQLENPVAIIQNPEKESLVVVTDKIDGQNRPILITIRKSKEIYSDNQRDKNRISSIYGRENFSRYLERQGKAGNILFIDEKRADKLLRSVHQQYQEATTTYGYKKNIPQPATSVNKQNEQKAPGSMQMKEWKEQIAIKKAENEGIRERDKENGRKTERTH